MLFHSIKTPAVARVVPEFIHWGSCATQFSITRQNIKRAYKAIQRADYNSVCKQRIMQLKHWGVTRFVCTWINSLQFMSHLVYAVHFSHQSLDILQTYYTGIRQNTKSKALLQWIYNFKYRLTKEWQHRIKQTLHHEQRDLALMGWPRQSLLRTGGGFHWQGRACVSFKGPVLPFSATVYIHPPQNKSSTRRWDHRTN